MHFNRLFYIITPLLLITSCRNAVVTTSSSDSTGKETIVYAKNATPLTDTTKPIDTAEDKPYATFYITMVDTAADYPLLDKKMYALSAATHILVDTQERHYDKKKKEIICPEDSDDEMYRGEYYPRRYEGVSLSIEQMSWFQEKSKQMGLMAAICTTSEQADSVLNVIKPFAPRAYVYKASLYMGCMH